METRILHIDLDSFFVSVERILDPSLIGKPVIVGGTESRGVVSSCSYEARKFGVHSAMPTIQAKKICPEGIFLKGNTDQYSKYSKMVTDLVRSDAPLYEKASIDEFYIDLSGMEKYFGAYKWATALRHKIIAETKLPISWGLSCNKMLAKMATNEAKPNGQLMIEPGKEQEFLDPLPIGKIPFCGEKTEKFLHGKGIKTIYELRQFSKEALEFWLGETGSFLWNRAHGIASTNIQKERTVKSMSSERTFHNDIGNKDRLRQIIIALSEKLAFELRAEKMTTSSVAIKIRYKDFSTHSKQMAISATANPKLLIEKALFLFGESYDNSQQVRLIGIRYGQLKEGDFQINLFDDTEKDVLLYQALDKVKQKHGTDKIILAQNIDIGNIRRHDPQAILNKGINKKIQE